MENIEDTIKDLEAKKASLESDIAKLEPIKGEVKQAEEKKEALLKEHQRILADITAARTDKKSATAPDIGTKLREENLQKAINQASIELGYDKNPDGLKALQEEFKKFDSGAINTENIYNDIIRTHAALNAHKYIQMEKDAKRGSAEANNLNANMSTSGFATGTVVTQEVQLDKEDIEAANRIHMPIDTYKKLKAEGKI